jgi:hypothetical protein
MDDRGGGLTHELTVRGVPGVEVGLGAGGQGEVAFVGPGQELAGRGESLTGKAADVGCERSPAGPVPQPGRHMPGGEPAQRLLVRVAVESGEAVHRCISQVSDAATARRRQAGRRWP